ncbi:3-hydroxyacyl-CoA dehydrogenase NAD-binding domain-containing protein [Streptomyces sp. NPDC057636]|uniref:3-hydroxyacyl-CoA dehydrogenase NAD-binding domain-containing protein n=1 Tax=Streptomyces sp. NPDC057636 TaxID=3346189 RepID=UPI0036782F2C
MDPVTRLDVVGCGLDVSAAETTPNRAEDGRRRLTTSLDRGMQRGKLTEKQRDQAPTRLSSTHDFSEMADRQFVSRPSPKTPTAPADPHLPVHDATRRGRQKNSFSGRRAAMSRIRTEFPAPWVSQDEHGGARRPVDQ